ncbi:MAG: chemotaxis response regulator protein-glutamate methylesterase, partial [Chlamydiia bacterium]|nr:chemotaxis response regulator protein-glutamate methylesterase [Chlamydiia bacterium]
EAARRIMSTSPIPIVLVSSQLKSIGTETSAKAMEVGALAILDKPESIESPNYAVQCQEIIETLRIMSEVRLVTRRFSKAPASIKIATAEIGKPEAVPLTPRAGQIEAVFIGTSLGGPQALMQVLSTLDNTIPVPILIVQHIAIGFTKGLVEWLTHTSSLPITTGTNGIKALPGHVYIAPDDQHMEITPNSIIQLVNAPPDHGLRPSVSRLFSSAARHLKERAIGIILTGMGNDGSRELLMMKETGAITIVQDPRTCLAFGMPTAAIELGAAQHILSLEQIGPSINKLLTASRLSY